MILDAPGAARIAAAAAPAMTSGATNFKLAFIDMVYHQEVTTGLNLLAVLADPESELTRPATLGAVAADQRIGR